MTLRYTHHRDPQEALRVRLRELAGSRVRYGYRRLTVLLKREGWQVNAKRIYRLYLEEGLIVRTQKRRERAQRQRVPLGQAARPNQKWSMDFVAQRLPDGRWIRVLTVVDQFTRECLTLFADNALSGEKVAIALDKVVPLRGAPESITVDNGTEFASKATFSATDTPSNKGRTAGPSGSGGGSGSGSWGGTSEVQRASHFGDPFVSRQPRAARGAHRQLIPLGYARP